MFKHILVPVDGSENALKALEKAVELKALTGAELTVLTIYRHHSMLEASFSMVRPQEPGNMDDIMRDAAKDVAEGAKAHAGELGAGNVRAFVRNGPVARNIVAFAEEHDVDLIVIGSRGLGSIESYLLGSVSHKVTGTAKCPVLVV
ncbi:universal stress protein [Microbaculum marinisediminis]|uniref:Universal stress protein n=1 Tax=Microbaculum marinisediminis TaxID=2931392 RepID=A0AAW5R2J5_9HYPH|nr:universal stress protein [Microbaculum sp. A6E488]MCT8974193.1 universal stress protein [Microbaculum sp. A6E488]